MRHSLIGTTLAALVCWAPSALACGGGFGQGLEVSPSQKIVIQHANGIESYTFSPHFCGEAAEFGLILPVPSQLASTPQLGSADLVPQLDELSAPIIKKETVCNDGFGAGGASGGLPDGGRNGVNVIEAGQVGMFDYVVLQADSQAAFTDWLGTNGFPYDTSSVATFDYYVSKGWYFVAFRVTASDTAPPAGSELCGDLGPLTVQFSAATPVIPARIAAVDTNNVWEFGWQVFTIGQDYFTVQDTGESWTELLYADVLDSTDLSQYPEIANVAAAGDRVTKLNVSFWGSDLTQDISLVANPSQAPYRATVYEYTYVQCEGGPGTGGSGTGGFAGGATGGFAGGGAGGLAGADNAGPRMFTESSGGCAVSAGRHAGVLSLAGLGAALGLVFAGRRRRR